MAHNSKKYTGKLKVGGGPVPFQRWTDKSRPEAAGDMRAEHPPKPKENGSARPK